MLVIRVSKHLKQSQNYLKTAYFSHIDYQWERPHFLYPMDVTLSCRLLVPLKVLHNYMYMYHVHVDTACMHVLYIEYKQ